MNKEKKLSIDFDEPLVWIYDLHYPSATKSELAKDPLVDFDRPMMVVDKQELAVLIEQGHKIEFI